MRINHNISSMTTQTSLFQVNKETTKTLQKLSTGLRINSAADDAAGLGVSENLRTQVRGMQQAMRNTQDSISLLQIADGALNEQANILQRMREIVIQAKNDTYTQTERDYMFQEFSGLMGELDRIAAATNFNGMNIFAAPEMQTGIDGQTIYPGNSYTPTPHKADDGRNIWDTPEEAVFGANDNGSANHFNMMIGANYDPEDAAGYNAATASFDRSASDLVTIQFGQMDSNAILSIDPTRPMGDASLVFDSFQWHPTFAGDVEDAWLSIAYTGAPNQGTVQTKLDYLLDLINGSDQDIPVIGFLRGADSNKTGLERVNSMRANIGAMVNRLEHATNNLINQITNTQSAESVLRDVDFATETATLSKNQILSQSSTAMLAQSNMIPKGILQLLG